MTRGQRNFILTLCFVFLALVVTTPLTDIGNLGRNYKSMPEGDHFISSSELKSFLTVWEKLVSKNIANYNNLQLSFGENNASEGLPSQLVRWLNTQGWGAERFFYDEQKIRELANIATLQNNLLANRRIKGYGMEAIVREQEEQLKNLSADPRELEIVSDNLARIVKILDIKPQRKN